MTRLHHLIVKLLNSRPYTLELLSLDARKWETMNDEEAAKRVPAAIRDLVAAGKISATIADGAVVYRLPLSVPMEKKSEPVEKTANQVWRDAERAHK